MNQLALIVCSALAALSLAGGLAAWSVADSRFGARLAARVGTPTQRSRDIRPIGGGLVTAILRILIRWGRQAGRGAVEANRRGPLRLRLVQAGFYFERAVELFFGIRAVAALGGVVAGVLTALALHAAGIWSALLVMGGANLGLFIPNMLLDRRIAARSRAMQEALPDAIDLTVASLEAGATLVAGLQRVVGEFAELHPVLAEQFDLMLMEIQAGASRAEALERLASRTPTPKLRALTAMLIQSEAVGASLGGALRVYAEDLRQSRLIDAERRAAELPVKLAFPLVFCVFPCLTDVIFAPVLIRILRNFVHL